MFKIEMVARSVLDELHAVIARGQNMAPAMREISAAMLDSVEQAFADEADPETGEPWAPLSIASWRGSTIHTGCSTSVSSAPISSTIGSMYRPSENAP